MTRHIPNLLTVGRFFLALGFFAILGFFYDLNEPAGWPVLDVALVVFFIAVMTDAVDGYLARRLGHTTTFGRIADPFVDKVIVCGALAYFIGDQFVQTTIVPGDLPYVIKENLTGWRPWMVAVILARELLVTGMRSFSESHHMPFAATLSGKIKMFVQCVAICWCIFYVEHWRDGPDWTRLVRDLLVWSTTLITAFSGLTYVKRAYDLLRRPPD
jgi:CDP-diacylglycerol---glycerol-3-phosphate 3-phosphatidyltransferase